MCVLGLQGELFGARLAAKYLDKELAGRIQQMQLLLQDLRTDEHDKLWKQLDAEIHLHRHKTVVRACRGRLTHNNNNLQQQQQQQQSQARHHPTHTNDVELSPYTNHHKRAWECQSRVDVSMVFPSWCLSFIQTHQLQGVLISLLVMLYSRFNDISLREVSHGDAAKILSSQEGQVRLEVVYVSTDDDDDDEGEEDGDAYGFRYKIFDDDLVSVSSSSSSQQLLPLPNNNNNNNGRLSRASVESVRGSTDNMLLDSPRRRAETETIDETTEHQHHTNGNHQHHQRQEEEEEEEEVEDRGDGDGGGASSSSLNDGGVSLNGAAAAAARLVFRDGGSDNERTNTNDDDDAPPPSQPPHTTTETSNTATEEEQQQQQQHQQEEEEEGVEGSVVVGGLILKPQDLSDLSCRDLTQDSVTESSLSSPSLDESEDSIHHHHTCNTPLQDIEQKLSQNFTIVEERKREEMERRREEEEMERKREEEEMERKREVERKRQEERDNSPPPSPADEIFNGSY
ncbi:hypothetical protein Pcinc_038391 [Petrolisthes cinctipes]|uniref:Uncharacterized protein n=1 Tax=Petrolisthes cinctipes TaxID=88211 RepID=A0AAE1BQR8_PETCI|nr:hypothetical protein Pcinc_038391 [Petrolisthes cinctipes]